MLKQRIIFSLFFIYSSFLISEDDNVEVDLLFLKIQELELEIAELRNILESQDYLIQKLIQESLDDPESNEDSSNLASDNSVRFAGIDDTRSKEEVYKTATESLQDQDFEKASSLFKFFVDNFNDFRPQDSDIPINNSLDRKRKEVRPRHYTNAVDLIVGPVTGVDPDEDLAFSNIEGVNVVRNNGVITLDYTEVEWLKQSFATRTESVTPFLISFWRGSMELTPASDTWVDTARLRAKIIDVEGDYSSTLELLARTENVDPQTGLAPIVWNAWETNWTGRTITRSTRIRNTSTSQNLGWGRRTTNRTIEDTVEDLLQL